MRSWVARLVAAGYVTSTIRGVFNTCAQVFAQAVDDGVIARSPCAGVSLPEDRRREETHFLTPEQVADLADAIHPRFRALVYTAAYTGMRAGELAALRVERTNLLARTIDVTESMMEIDGELVAGPTKTGRVRTISIPATVAQMIGEHIGRYPSQDGFVFTMVAGGAIRQRNFYRRYFKPAAVMAASMRISSSRLGITVGGRIAPLLKMPAATIAAFMLACASPVGSPPP